MSCFIAPLAQAVATTLYRRHHRSQGTASRSIFLQHLDKFELMLWGGTSMLIVDHIINGEVTWRYPFFTALEQQGGFQTMLQEILTVGVPMSIVITLIYVAICWRYQKAKSK